MTETLQLPPKGECTFPYRLKFPDDFGNQMSEVDMFCINGDAHDSRLNFITSDQEFVEE